MWLKYLICFFISHFFKNFFLGSCKLWHYCPSALHNKNLKYMFPIPEHEHVVLISLTCHGSTQAVVRKTEPGLSSIVFLVIFFNFFFFLCFVSLKIIPSFIETTIETWWTVFIEKCKFSLTPTPPHGNITNILWERIPEKIETWKKWCQIYSNVCCRAVHFLFMKLIYCFKNGFNLNYDYIVE